MRHFRVIQSQAVWLFKFPRWNTADSADQLETGARFTTLGLPTADDYGTSWTRAVVADKIGYVGGLQLKLEAGFIEELVADEQ